MKIMGAGWGTLTLAGLAGCSGGNDAATSGSSAAPTSGPAKGGKAVISYKDSADTMFLPASSTTLDRFYASPALESLGRLDKDGNTEPWLAEALDVDKDALTLTITLRDGVKFSDGSDCNAEAVAWNLQQYVDNGHASELDNPTSFETPDDKTVVVHYDTWNNDWDNVIGQCRVCSKQSFDENGQEWAATHPVGTGPFVIDDFVAGTSISYKRNDDYRIEGQPYLDEIEFSIITDVNTQIASMQNDEVNGLITQDMTAIQTLEGSGFENVSANGPEQNDIMYFLFNSLDTSKPCGDIRVREAIMHCIDWENVASSLTGGLGKACNQFALEGSWAYNPDVKFFEYDPEQGMQLLSDAGFPDGFDIDIYTISNNEPIATALQSCLSEIGITGNIQVVDSSVLASMQEADSIDGIVIGRGSSKMDFLNNYIRLYSKEGIKNHGIMLCPDDYEQALANAKAAETTDEKKKWEQEASKMLVETYIMLCPMASVPTGYFVSAGFTDHELGQTIFEQWAPEAAYFAA